MNHRRLRLPAAITLLALAAPVLAADPSRCAQGALANLQCHARAVRDTVHRNSVEFGHQVTHSARQARHQFTVQWYRAGTSIRHWWDHTRETVARI